MNMQTKVVLIHVGDGIIYSTLDSEINNSIKEYESKGWYLRGTPVYIEKIESIMFTFETPDTGDSKGDTGDSKGKENEVVPPPPIEKLLRMGKEDDK